MSDSIAETIAARVDGLDALDGVAETVGETVRGVLEPGGQAKHVLSGAWLGHALHPVLTDLPIGSFTSAVLLDFFGGDADRASERLLLFGLLAAPATFASGWSDWSDAERQSPAVRRAGLVHAVSNGTGVGLMIASYSARKRGRRGRGKLLSLAGMGLLGAGGWLGGHLAYTLGAGVDAARQPQTAS
jgi:uncharacterized membrane protein